MLDEQRVRPPDFPPDTDWAGSLRPPRRAAAWLVDFWDYTCVNCRRSLPYVIEWSAKYQSAGLETIGVHAPEFSFACQAPWVERAMSELGIPYPVALDNDYVLWEAFGNAGWPSRFLIDAGGDVRHHHLGEGEYLATELAIQAVLAEANPAFRPAPLTIPKREEDAPGVVCHRPSPELYCGYERSNPGEPLPADGDVVVFHADPGRHEPDRLYLQGAWRTRPEYCALAGESGSITLRYRARGVNAVMAPAEASLPGQAAAQPPTVTIYQDGDLLPPSHAGADVILVDGRPAVTPDWPHMVRLVSNPGFEAHELRLEVRGRGCAVYSFAFTTCAVRP